MSDERAAAEGLPASFLDFYDDALSQVYGYLWSRCSQTAVAEDLTSETFLAAVDAARRDNPPAISMPWIIGVARHKLVDHWRRSGREASGLRALTDQHPTEETADPSDSQLDAVRARATLATLAPNHQAVLTLRYIDDLPVAEVAALLGRTLHATEALLTRARRALRHAYDDGDGDGEETSDV